jgi:hypothetical protein
LVLLQEHQSHMRGLRMRRSLIFGSAGSAGSATADDSLDAEDQTSR